MTVSDMSKPLIGIVTLLASFAAVAWLGAWFSTPSVSADTSFVVAQGDSAAAVAMRLKDDGIIRSVTLFRLTLARTGVATRLQPGSYDLSSARSYADIARLLSSSAAYAPEVTIRILEGWDLYQIADHLASQGLPGREELFAVTGVPGVSGSLDLSSRFAFLADKPSSASLEGYLFPDTYRVFPDATAADIIDVMLTNFDRKLTEELRLSITASGRSVFEIVTMASIVEREVRGDRDQRMVADLFWRRLRIGMALQADSTVNYVTRKNLPSVTYEDLEIDSRYNTYKYPGLPPGPIGNPGMQAIIAAIEPTPNPYLFFLTSPDGTVHYGRTLEEHVANRRFLR